MTGRSPAIAAPGRRIALLAGQGFALGLTLSWVLIPASAIFLGDSSRSYTAHRLALLLKHTF